MQVKCSKCGEIFSVKDGEPIVSPCCRVNGGEFVIATPKKVAVKDVDTTETKKSVKKTKKES